MLAVPLVRLRFSLRRFSIQHQVARYDFFTASERACRLNARCHRHWAAGFRAPGHGLPGSGNVRPGDPRQPPSHPFHFTLPNVQAGTSFRNAIQIHPQGTPAVRWLAIDLPANSGLMADVASGQVFGTVAQAGEIPIRLQFCLAADAQARPHMGYLTLLVTPDPKSLWQDHPSDRTAPYWRSDTCAASQRDTYYRLLAASKRGRSHAHKGGFREDDCWMAQAAGGWSLALVADGAGSARYSRQGSHLACRVTGEALQQALGQGRAAMLDAAVAVYRKNPRASEGGFNCHLADLLGPALRQAVAAIKAAAASVGEPDVTARDFASTLLLTLCKRFPFGHFVVCFSVGDGAVALYRQHQSVTLLSTGDAGEYAGQTCFLDADALNPTALGLRIRFALADDFTALLLMTDGVSDPHFDTPSALGQIEAWDALWQAVQKAMAGAADEPQRAGHLLAWLDFWVPGHHDDRTLLLVEPRND